MSMPHNMCNILYWLCIYQLAYLSFGKHFMPLCHLVYLLVCWLICNPNFVQSILVALHQSTIFQSYMVMVHKCVSMILKTPMLWTGIGPSMFHWYGKTHYNGSTKQTGLPSLIGIQRYENKKLDQKALWRIDRIKKNCVSELGEIEKINILFACLELQLTIFQS